MLTCVVCDRQFTRKGTRGPIPKYCSQPCITKSKRTPQRIEYERNYRLTERLLGKRDRYRYEYNRRPYVKEKERQRYALRWTDPEFRRRENERMRTTIHPEVVVAAPYTGHRWLDMAANVVGREFDPTAPWADDYYDDMGEAVLALLEGRDMEEAVRAYRSKEYVPRKLTIRLGDWREDEDMQNKWFESVMPKAPSAEDDYLDKEAATYYTATRFNDVSTARRSMRHRTSTPSNRRSNNR